MTAPRTAPADRQARVVVPLGLAQTLAWASSYYLPAVLATPMAQDLGVGAPTVFAAFSLALVVSALVGPLSGRSIDQRGGRPVLLGTSVLFAAGLAALGLAQGPATMLAAWLLLGVAMGAGLYEAAFATLVRLYGQDSRNAITGITLMAGFDEHGRLALVGLAGDPLRLALDLPDLGGAAPAGRPAAECAGTHPSAKQEA